MRQFVKASPDKIEEDYERRVKPSFSYCVQVGNIYSATTYMALSGLIDYAELDGFKRVGIYSYGSGCSSEFYSGIINSHSKSVLREMKIQELLSSRYELNMEEYDKILDLNMEWMFGIQDKVVDFSSFSRMYEHFFEGRGMLVLKEVKGFHRKYDWS